jgi:flagellar M-ring protein FliF
MVGLVVFFGLIRPALKAALEPLPAQAGNNLNAVVADEEPLPEPELQMLEPPKTNPQLEQARILAKDNPAAVAGIVREWVSGEAA